MKGYVVEDEAWDKKLGNMFGFRKKKGAPSEPATGTKKINAKPKSAVRKTAASTKITKAKAEGTPKAKKGWW